MTMRMLIEGHSDPVSAKRLGVSPRTYAGYVADLKAEYDAETRFQLGYTMGRMGISGQEVDDRRGLSDSGPRRLPARNVHEGSDLMVTALVLLRRAWGVRRWDRTSGGKVGSSSQICGVLAQRPAGVAEGGRSPPLAASAGAAAPIRPTDTAVAETTMAIRRAMVFMVFPQLGLSETHGMASE